MFGLLSKAGKSNENFMWDGHARNKYYANRCTLKNKHNVYTCLYTYVGVSVNTACVYACVCVWRDRQTDRCALEELSLHWNPRSTIKYLCDLGPFLRLLYFIFLTDDIRIRKAYVSQGSCEV